MFCLERTLRNLPLAILATLFLFQTQMFAEPLACTLANNVGSEFSFIADNQPGDRTIIYFNFDQCSGPDLGYPYELLSVSFSLVDLPGAQWPASVDLVIYDRAADWHQCNGPGIELCRYNVTCERVDFEYPNFGTFTLPSTCCLKGPFFVGIEYLTPVGSVSPALALDAQSDGERCKAWQYSATEAIWQEWLVHFENSTQPGFPKMSLEILANSENCPADCISPTDFDGNGLFTIGDCVFYITWRFGGGPAPNMLRLDLNEDCIITEAEINAPSGWCPGGIIEPPTEPVCTCPNPWVEGCAANPGDANGDAQYNISDAVYLVNFIFASGSPPTPYAIASGDANGDCVVSVSDAVYMINFVFAGGPSPQNCLYWPLNCGDLR